jgi:hypothetical protein
MIAARGRVKLARFAAQKTPAIMADERSPRKPGKTAASHIAKRETRGAIQIAAASKKKHHKVQLSQG